MSGIAPWQEVLDFWFPERCDPAVAADVHLQHWTWRMHGGADAAIIARFANLTALGAEGGLDHWAAASEGRLALIVVLDQFSRSLWRGTPRAFAQDGAALPFRRKGWPMATTSSCRCRGSGSPTPSRLAIAKAPITSNESTG